MVLGINSKCLLHADIIANGGVIDVTHVSPPDHAITVVGWKMIDGLNHWIARNSWGQLTVPAKRPDDPACVGEDFNECDTGTNLWIGDQYNPGYAYIPFDYKGIAGLPSPWFDALPHALRKALPMSHYDDTW